MFWSWSILYVLWAVSLCDLLCGCFLSRVSANAAKELLVPYFPPVIESLKGFLTATTEEMRALQTQALGTWPAAQHTEHIPCHGTGVASLYRDVFF